MIVEEVERLHWRTWNGEARDAQIGIDRIRAAVRHVQGEPKGRTAIASSRKLRAALRALDRHLTGQSAWLVNYAERHRAGLRVGTASTEGTANVLANRRMNKSQQTPWSRRGADLLLQALAPSAMARSAPASDRSSSQRSVSDHGDRRLTHNLATVSETVRCRPRPSGCEPPPHHGLRPAPSAPCRARRPGACGRATPATPRLRRSPRSRRCRWQRPGDTSRCGRRSPRSSSRPAPCR